MQLLHEQWIGKGTTAISRILPDWFANQLTWVEEWSVACSRRLVQELEEQETRGRADRFDTHTRG